MAKICSRPGCERERASTHNYCAEHWAEYQREYGHRKIEDSFRKGTREGVSACARYLRERLGDRAITGNQAAQLLLRASNGVSNGASETAEAAQRRKMIESLQGPQA